MLILGANWPEALTARFETLLGGRRVIRHAVATEAQFREASVLVPTSLRVDRLLVEGSAIRLIHQFGVGVDNVDLDAMKQLGVAVANAPSERSKMAASVAEGAVYLVLSRARLPSLRARHLAQGKWNWRLPVNLGPAGRRAGLVGIGSIGKALAKRLQALEGAKGNEIADIEEMQRSLTCWLDVATGDFWSW